jgi:hypothetical protein
MELAPAIGVLAGARADAGERTLDLREPHDDRPYRLQRVRESVLHAGQGNAHGRRCLRRDATIASPFADAAGASRYATFCTRTCRSPS